MKTKPVSFLIAWVFALIVSAQFVNAQISLAPTGVVNISTRVTLNSANPFFITGFVISGATPKTVLIRAIGPGLTLFGVADANPDPRIEMFKGDGSRLAGNDDWEVFNDPAFSKADILRITAQVGAFALTAGSYDASLLVTLPPGVYTARIAGSRGDLGTILLEFYVVP